MNMEGLVIRESAAQSGVTLRLMGDIIISNAGELQRHINAAIDRGVSDLTLDLSAVEYIDSFGIGVIIQTQSNLDTRPSGRLRVFANKRLLSVFQQSNLEQYIDILPAEKMKDREAKE